MAGFLVLLSNIHPQMDGCTPIVHSTFSSFPVVSSPRKGRDTTPFRFFHPFRRPPTSHHNTMARDMYESSPSSKGRDTTPVTSPIITFENEGFGTNGTAPAVQPTTQGPNGVVRVGSQDSVGNGRLSPVSWPLGAPVQYPSFDGRVRTNCALNLPFPSLVVALFRTGVVRVGGQDSVGNSRLSQRFSTEIATTRYVLVRLHDSYDRIGEHVLQPVIVLASAVILAHPFSYLQLAGEQHFRWLMVFSRHVQDRNSAANPNGMLAVGNGEQYGREGRLF
ncbi:hypothetical protein BC567DRAFT_300155 [Phyllosticta citribraziliensis]